MEQFLTNLLDNTELPVLYAFILGLMTAISPCPLATNITAIGFISKDIKNRRKVFWDGLIYTLGRAVSYTSIGFIFYFGASQFKISGFLQQWGEKILGPLLIVLGVMMLDIFRIKFPGLNTLTNKVGSKAIGLSLQAFLLGVIFALAFCPYSGVLYFGILIPMTITSASGLYLPLIFAIGTGIPVIIFAWFIAFSISKVGKFYNRMKIFEKWFRRIIAVLFIVVGIYYVIIIYF